MNKFHNVKGKKSWVALKPHMEKAYDIVEWLILIEALHKLGVTSPTLIGLGPSLLKLFGTNGQSFP